MTPEKKSNGGNGNGINKTTIAQVAISALERLGLPTVLILVGGYVVIEYYIQPQTAVMEAQTEALKSQTEMSENLAGVLGSGMQANQKQLEKIAESTEETRVLMQDATESMKDVPAQRTEELKLLRELAGNSYPDEEFRQKVFDQHKEHKDQGDEIIKELKDNG